MRSLQCPDGLSRPARLHRPTRSARRVEASRAPCRSEARDDGAVRPRAEERRSRAAVRKPGGGVPRAGRRHHSRPRQPLRHAAARGAGDGGGRRRLARGAARDRPPARVPQGAGAAEEPQGRVAEHAPGVHEGARHGAEGALVRAMPGRDVGRRGRRSRAAAGADLLARRCGAAHHLGPYGHARTAQEAAEPRHLPAAGDCAEQGHHALARPPRRRARLPRSRARASRHAVSGGRGARRRSGDDPRRGDAGAGLAVGVPVRRPAARRAHRARQVRFARPRSPRVGGDRARRLPAARCGRSHRVRDGGRGPVRRPHRLLQRSGALSRLHDRAHHAAPRPHLPFDVHRQAAGRAGDARASR